MLRGTVIPLNILQDRIGKFEQILFLPFYVSSIGDHMSAGHRFNQSGIRVAQVKHSVIEPVQIHDRKVFDELFVSNFARLSMLMKTRMEFEEERVEIFSNS